MILTIHCTTQYPVPPLVMSSCSIIKSVLTGRWHVLGSLVFTLRASPWALLWENSNAADMLRSNTLNSPVCMPFFGHARLVNSAHHVATIVPSNETVPLQITFPSFVSATPLRTQIKGSSFLWPHSWDVNTGKPISNSILIRFPSMCSTCIKTWESLYAITVSVLL